MPAQLYKSALASKARFSMPPKRGSACTLTNQASRILTPPTLRSPSCSHTNAAQLPVRLSKGTNQAASCLRTHNCSAHLCQPPRSHARDVQLILHVACVLHHHAHAVAQLELHRVQVLWWVVAGAAGCTVRAAQGPCAPGPLPHPSPESRDPLSRPLGGLTLSGLQLMQPPAPCIQQGTLCEGPWGG